MNMKRNKESGEEEGGGGEISTDAGSYASNPCFGAARPETLAVVPATAPAAPLTAPGCCCPHTALFLGQSAAG